MIFLDPSSADSPLSVSSAPSIFTPSVRWCIGIDADDFRLSPTASSDRFSFHLPRSRSALLEGYWNLRRTIFCHEQGLFEDSDRDAQDTTAHPIVAIDHSSARPSDGVVGVVRIHESSPGIWYGGRLGVRGEFRRHNQIGKGLIWKAVTTAHGWGCERFLATVQLAECAFLPPLALEFDRNAGDPWRLPPPDGGRSELLRPPLGTAPPAPGGMNPAPAASPLAAMVSRLRAHPGLRHKTDIQQPAALLDPLPFPDLGPAGALGDDAALLPETRGRLLLACEGMDPDLVATDPWFAGWSGVLVNLSDIAAMGGRPLAVVNSLWCREAERAERILEGMRYAAEKFAVPVVGGHTNLHSPYDALSVAVLGSAVGPVLSARQAQPGDPCWLLINLQGAFHGERPFWDAATGSPGKRLRSGIWPCWRSWRSGASPMPPRTSAWEDWQVRR